MAETYAVVEFESTRECAVVPVLWIVQNETQCYRPWTKTEEAFHKLLAEVAPYQKSWQLFPVRRILHTTDDLQAAEDRSTDALDNGTSAEGCEDITSVTRKKIIDEGNFSSQGHSASPLCQNQNNNNIEKTSCLERELTASQKSRYNRKTENFPTDRETVSVAKKSVTYKEYSSSPGLSPSPPGKNQKYDKNRENSSPIEEPSPTANTTQNNDNRRANFSSEEEPSPLPKRKKKHHKNKENSFSEEESLLSSKRKLKDHKRKDNHKKHSKRTKHKNRSETSESESTSSVMNVSEPEDRGIPNRCPSTPAQTSSSIKRPMLYGHKDAVVDSGAQYQRSITGVPGTSNSTNMNERIQSDNNTLTIFRPSLDANQRDRNASLTTPQSQLVPLPDCIFQERVVRYFERITAKQKENTIILNQILRYAQATNALTAKPENMPELPLKDMLSFQNLDTRLQQDEASFAYLKNRLASIGGLNQRQSVMSMMRFLFSNELAMRFNWAGQNQKRSFKQTTVKEVIFEACAISIRGKIFIAAPYSEAEGCLKAVFVDKNRLPAHFFPQLNNVFFFKYSEGM